MRISAIPRCLKLSECLTLLSFLMAIFMWNSDSKTIPQKGPEKPVPAKMRIVSCQMKRHLGIRKQYLNSSHRPSWQLEFYISENQQCWSTHRTTLSWKAKGASDPRVCLKTQTWGTLYKVVMVMQINICIYKDNINSFYLDNNFLLEDIWSQRLCWEQVVGCRPAFTVSPGVCLVCVHKISLKNWGDLGGGKEKRHTTAHFHLFILYMWRHKQRLCLCSS